MPPAWVNEDGGPVEARLCPRPGCGREHPILRYRESRRASYVSQATAACLVMVPWVRGTALYPARRSWRPDG